MRRLATSLLFILAPLSASLADEPSLIIGQVKAVGIVGASAVAHVGFFHPGGPIHDKPAFAALTEPERVIDKDRVLVEGINRVWKHVKPSQRYPQGGRIQKEAPIHISNVLPLDPTTGKGTRIKMEVRDGFKHRVAIKSGTDLGKLGKA